MIKREWQSLLKNKFMIVAIIAIMVIPTIYTTIFLGSMWDPYGEIDKLPVAIVNKDESVEYNGKTMDVGSELVDNLKENNSLDFNFVDADVAKNGLENGTYYMVVTIPEDFSANATTLMDDDPAKMQLDYEVNPGSNFIASKMSESAVSEIRNSLQEKITEQYAETIFEEVQTLGDGLNEAADGASSAVSGVQQLKDGNDKITANLDTLASSTLTFKDGADELNVGLKEYTDGVSKANNGSAQLSAAVGELSSTKVPQLVNGIGQLSGNSNALNTGISQIEAGNNEVLNGLKEMDKQIIAGKKELEPKLNEAEKDAAEMNEQISSLKDSVTAKITSASTALSNINALGNDAQQKYNNIEKSIKNTSAYKSLTPEQQEEILKQVRTNDITADITSITASSTGIKNALVPSDENNKSLMESLDTIIKKKDNVFKENQAIMSTLAGSINNIQNALEMDKGLIKGTEALDRGIKQEKAGISQYTGGVDKVNSSMPELSSGIPTLASKLQELSSGLNTLNSNNSKLLSGSSQLSDGADKIHDGADKLHEGSATLGNGLNDLYDGANKLNDGLSSGAEEVNSIDPSDDTYSMMASPVETNETKITKIDNNGNAMAPYMMCVGLWVACIAFCLMYPLTSHEGKMKSGFKWWLSKVSVVGIVSIVQAIVMVLMLESINGLDPVRKGQMILISCLLSVTFMAIVYFFNFLLDKIGEFLMLIFMVLQLGGCGGTYPLDLAAHFYTAIKPFMPFTYGVHAFRSAISGGVSITQDIIVLLLILAVFIALTIVVFNAKAKKIRESENIDEDEALTSVA